MTLLVAGIESTAVALTWAVHLLCQYPDVQERLRTETAEVLGTRNATWDDLPRLDLARRVITETLRIYPPGWILTRTTATEARLADTVIPPKPPSSTARISSTTMHDSIRAPAASIPTAGFRASNMCAAPSFRSAEGRASASATIMR